MYKHDYVCLGVCIRNYVLCKKGKYFKGTNSIHKISMCKIDTGRFIGANISNTTGESECESKKKHEILLWRILYYLGHIWIQDFTKLLNWIFQIVFLFEVSDIQV